MRLETGSDGCGLFGEETAQFLHGFGFDLADALGRHAVFVGQLVQGQPAVVLQPAAFDDAAAAVVKLRSAFCRPSVCRA